MTSRRSGDPDDVPRVAASPASWRPALLVLALLVAHPAADAFGAIAFVKSIGTNGNATTGTTIAVTVPAGGVAASDTVIVTVALDPVSGTVSAADSRGNAYTSNADVQNGTAGSGTGVRTVVLSSRLTTALLAGDAITVTVPSVAAKAVSVNEFSGLAATAMLDQTSTSTGTSTAPTSNATATTTLADELLVGAIGVESNLAETFTVGSLFTALTRVASGANATVTNDVTIDPEYRIVSATGAYAATGTLGTSRRWGAAIATYRAARCGNGAIEPGEQCDDGNLTNGDCCSSTCQFESVATVCRAAAGACDVAETCTGTSGTCPANLLVAPGIVCRASAGICDVAETCSGTSAACPADGLVAAGTVCRAAADVCDAAESCTGTSASCPADGRVAAGTACTSDNNPCTLDRCDGTNVACQHPAGNAGAVCRPSAGDCDPGEVCSGTSASCPADVLAPAGTVCTSDGNPCTVDQCDGTNVVCQHPVGNGGAVCRPAAGACDVDEACTGTSATCPSDAKSTAVCRPSAGDCDRTESCDGVHNDCPADTFVAAGTVCRAAASPCDRVEVCTGSDAVCPPDTAQPDGGPCDDGDRCTIGDVCRGGVCAGTTAVDCPDPFLCYKARSSVAFTALSGVHLMDAFESSYVTVRKPSGLCMPASVDDTAVVGANRRLDGYAVKSQSGVARQTNVRLVNQLGALMLNTGKADVLRVPGTLPTPPSTDPNGYVDHYKCYKAFVTPGTPKLRPGLVVFVQDGTMTSAKPYELKKPGHVCLPVDVDGRSMQDPDILELCYRAVPAPSVPRNPAQLGIHLSDDFAAPIFTTVKELEVCLPSVRVQ